MTVAVAVMGHHCCSKQKVKRGLWSPEEDQKLIRYITTNGHGCWSSIPKQAGLQRCGKSCRLRWINYLRPDLKRGSFSTEEERIIIDVHRIVGNRWAQIAKHLPGRTDNEVKNFWNSCIKKKLIAQGLDPKTHNLLPSSRPPNTINGCNLSQFPHHPQPSSTPFTISSNIRRFDTIKGNSVDMSPPFVTISPAPAPAPPNIPLHETITFPNFQYQDPNVLMSFNDQSSHSAVEFPNCSSSLEHSHISPSFDQPSFMDETCLWPGTLDILEDPKQNELEPHQGLDLGQEQSQNVVRKMDFNEANEEKGVHTDASYNSAVFDLELMESALIPYGVFCNGSSMEQLQWDC